jgi:uncharacterized protein
MAPWPSVVEQFETGWKRSDEGKWLCDQVPAADLEGCDYIDLGITPSTKALPINRLGLAVGASAEILAAWVRFPELTVSPMAQRYTRVAANTYFYENVGSDFKAIVEVDSAGLPLTYEGLWQRLSATS